ncbi:MAG: rRNA maturation RNase YbeY [Holosporaceae bacterium]|jgi:probable rRNA maturation factor|nr:rRNA maturation RNase YbeY [Holosporaceae bacterium]
MNLDISVECDLWNEAEVRVVTKDSLDAAFSIVEPNLLDENKFRKSAIEICFLFTNDYEVRLLNKTYRGIDKPTNVLSFPTNSTLPKIDGDCLEEKDAPICVLGSVALAYETIKRESLDQSKSMENHLKHLIVHSMLHLLGHSHDDPVAAEKMESLEIVILRKLNVSNPYQRIEVV